MKTGCIRLAAFIFTLLLCVFASSCDNGYTFETEPETTESETLEISYPEQITAAETTALTEETSAVETEPPIAGKNLRLNGTMNSENSGYIGLRLEWNASQTDDDSRARLSVRIYLDCYGINIGERSCTLTIAGESFEFTAPACEGEDTRANSFEIYSGTFAVSSPPDSETTLSIKAVYPFGGTYGGERFGELSVAGDIRLYDMGEEAVDPYKPELPDSPFGN